MDKILNFCREHIVFIYGFLILVLCIILFFNNNYTYFWYDEGFSISLAKHSYSDIWFLTAKDVHPPFYYFLLKAYSLIVDDSIQALRFFSVIPILLTMIVCCTLIRKQWGNKTAIFFLLFLLLTPQTKYMASEIRMYSWVMFFVLMSFIYAYMSFIRDKRYYFILFLLFSLMAAYTHYYGLIAIFFMYAVYFALSLFYDRKKLLPFVIVSVLFILLYMPWLLNLLNQVKSVTEEYWISSDMWRKGLLENIYPLGKIGVLKLGSELTFCLQLFILIAFFAYCFFSASKSAKDRKVFYTCSVLFLLFLLPIITGIIYSVAIKPVFIPRYMCCFIGMYMLGAALLFSTMDIYKRGVQVILFLFFGFSIYFNVSLFKHKFRDNRNDSKELNEIIHFIDEGIDKNTVFLYTDSVYPQLAIYPVLFPDNIHICKISPETNKRATVIDVFDYVPVSSFKDLDTTYSKLYIVDHLPEGGHNLMQIGEDSIVITQQYKVSRELVKIVSYRARPTRAYELKKKP